VSIAIALETTAQVTSVFVAAWTTQAINTRAKNKKMLADAVHIALLQNSVDGLIESFKKETGGNSGGFREKLNSLEKTLEDNINHKNTALKEINKKVDTAISEISFIRGQIAGERSA
jgi:hypothetical protein